jgi:uncharacterized phage-associated protein
MPENKKALKLIHTILENAGVCDFWKVFKLMYFIDFDFYLHHKKSISGEVYYHLPYGPVPNTNYADNLILAGEHLNYWSVKKHSLYVKPVDKIDGEFTQEETETINRIIEKYRHLSGKELVDLSHEDAPWTMTDMNEVIDYDYVFWRETEPMTYEDITEKILNA